MTIRTMNYRYLKQRLKKVCRQLRHVNSLHRLPPPPVLCLSVSRQGPMLPLPLTSLINFLSFLFLSPLSFSFSFPLHVLHPIAAGPHAINPHLSSYHKDVNRGNFFQQLRFWYRIWRKAFYGQQNGLHYSHRKQIRELKFKVRKNIDLRSTDSSQLYYDIHPLPVCLLVESRYQKSSNLHTAINTFL